MQDYLKEITQFLKKEIFIKDFLAPLRILALLYIFIGFYLPVGWSFIKNTILLFLNSVSSGTVLQGTNGISLFVMWWLYVADLTIVSCLFYAFIKALNSKGAKKLYALLPMLGVFVLMLSFLILIGIIDKFIPFVNLINTLIIIDNFLKI